MRYRSRKWRTDWQNAKKRAGLSDKLFKKGLGKDMETADALYKKMMAAKDSKTFGPPAKKLGELRGKLKVTISDYEKIVNANGGDRGALKVLSDARTEFCDNTLSDHGEKTKEFR